jgi:hypothetical protein
MEFPIVEVEPPNEFNHLDDGQCIRNIYFHDTHDGDLRIEYHPQFSSDMEKFLSEKIDERRSRKPSDSEAEEDPFEEGPFRIKKGNKYTILYEDPFKVLAGRFFAESRGLNPPKIRVWPADVLRLQDQISPQMFRWEYFGEKPPKQRIRWAEVASIDVKIDFLWKHTHWGYKLQQMCNDPDTLTSTRSLFLRKRIKHFLEGKPDPFWNERRVMKIYKDKTLRSSKSRSYRFLEMLKTVDGVFTQLYTAIPYEIWNWEKFDIFVLKLISELLYDEFMDGELTLEALSIPTRFQELKNARKHFKREMHNRPFEEVNLEELITLKEWLHFFYPRWASIEKVNMIVRTYQIGMFSQSRGAGKPPPSVVLGSKRKFLLQVSAEPKVSTATEKKLMITALNEVLETIPDSVFTGLSTKARIQVTSSACWETTQAEGGTLEAIRHIVHLGQSGIPTNIIDLDTGQTIRQEILANMSVGEYVFWESLNYVLRADHEELKRVFVVMITEPAKARTVTKGSACLKIVLDLVNKICSYPLTKVDSSTSGMGKANHAWNLFRKMFSSDWEDLFFSAMSSKEEVINEDLRKYEVVYNQVFCLSTDYENATDAMQHDIAALLGMRWMQKCGIPRVLATIVKQTCFSDRWVYFYGNTCLSVGELTDPDKNLRRVRCKTGIMMGDPLTKVVLHLTNIVIRRLSFRIYQFDFIQKIFPTDANYIMEEILSMYSK